MDLETSKAIRKKWYNVKKQDHAPEWDDLGAFTEWFERESGGQDRYKILRRFNQSKPFGPDNCYLQDLTGGQHGDQTDEDVIKWNKTVNVFRRAFGLPLFREE